MIKWKKYMCVALSAAMMATLTTGCGDTSNDSTTSDKAEATTESDSDTLQDALAAEISADDSDDADKEETVYVLADADGTANDVTVSTWLKNADGSEGLNDKTNLSDIENVKGYEGYKDNGDGTITWAANGSDIYYQGKSSEKLPVDVKITYKLDGEEIEPSELAGKSGKVTIRFDYTNNTKQTVKAGSKNSEVISPFVMLSGMILPVDKFSNVQVENGKVISEGSNQIVVGYAVGIQNAGGIIAAIGILGKLVSLAQQRYTVHLEPGTAQLDGRGGLPGSRYQLLQAEPGFQRFILRLVFGADNVS